MSTIDRRTLLYAFGIASVSSVLPAPAGAAAKVAVARPGENRFAFGSAAQAKTSPCKVSSEDSAGRAPFLSSTHCRVPEHSCTFIIVRTSGITFYPVNFSLEQVAKNTICWLAGASGCPGIPHVWANTATADGKLGPPIFASSWMQQHS
jgi:hypothetical protein